MIWNWQKETEVSESDMKERETQTDRHLQTKIGEQENASHFKWDKSYIHSFYSSEFCVRCPIDWINR